MKPSAGPERQSSVILLSGGLDSAANLALCHARDQPVMAITVDYGQRAAWREVQAARALCQYYEVPFAVVDQRWLGALGGSSLTEKALPLPTLQSSELDDLTVTVGSAKSVWVPNRNGVLINLAAAYAERAGARRVVVGFNREEATTFPDNSLAFLNQTTAALSFSTANQVTVFSYSVNWDKREIVQALRRLSKPFPFEMLWSCYTDQQSSCGICESCRRLARALEMG